MNETHHSPDAMHWTPEPDTAGTDTTETVTDPVAGLDPDTAARVLEAAAQIDPVALLAAIERQRGTDGHV